MSLKITTPPEPSPKDEGTAADAVPAKAGDGLFSAAGPLFPEMIRGTFIDRPNRFVIRCLVGNRVQRIYLPNPGRLWEILLPGVVVFLARSRTGKLPYIAVAAEKDGLPILLHTHLTNDIVARLIEKRLIPGLEKARILRREYRQGRSRFDFLLEMDGRPFLLEAKSCTLFGRRIAMFPDAVTARGRRHLRELAALSRAGTPGGVVFLVHSPQPRFFLPDYHTDPDFARIFHEVKNDIFLKAIAVEWRRDLTLEAGTRDLTIPWDLLKREAKDRGDYLLMLQLSRDQKISVGSLGTVAFRKGFYLYVGSARKTLTKRLERHLRKKKNPFWHVDYLNVHADHGTAIPIRSSASREHELAQALLKIGQWSIPRFGSSDCNCKTHLVGMPENPIHSPAFVQLLTHFRIDRLEKELPGNLSEDTGAAPDTL